MVAPIGAFLILDGHCARQRVLGLAVLSSCLIGIVASGARGGYISILSAAIVFACLWVVREFRVRPRSLVGPLIIISAIAFSICVVALVFGSNRIHNIVIGGGIEAYSNQARLDQWNLAVPKILSNPLTGHGYGNSGEVVGYRNPDGTMSLDSYFVSLLVDIGVPGLGFFLLMLAAGTWTAAATSVSDPSWKGGLNLAFASTVVAFATYRTVLIELENQTLFFLILGLIMATASAKDYPSSQPFAGQGTFNAER